MASRMKNAATTFSNDNEPLFTDIRRTVELMKDIAVHMEKDKQSDMVKELEDAVVELLEASEDFAHFSTAVQSVVEGFQPGEQLTDFKKMFEDEASKVKANTFSDPKKHLLVRNFKEAVWNVHHEGQPMPGEELEDIVMTSTQGNILNFNCPLTGKPITELEEPVRSVQCRHIYEKNPIMQYIRSKTGRGQCPVAGCPKILQVSKVTCDPYLRVDIDEVRRMSKETARTDVIEDFTMLGEDEDE